MVLSNEKRIRLVIVAIIIAGLSIIFLSLQLSLKKGLYRESEQMLYQIGKDYEFEIKSEISRIYSIAEFLALSFSKNAQNKDFKPEFESIIRNLIYRYPRLKSVDLILKTSNIPNDQNNIRFSFQDSVPTTAFRLVKTNSGILEESDIQEYNSKSLKVAIERAILSNQTKMLPPEIFEIDGQNTTVIPFISSIYKGNQFQGYILMYLSVDWMGKGINKAAKSDGLEVFVASPDKKVIALNNNLQLLAEPISKSCISCRDLLGNKGQDYNSAVLKDYTTVCIPWKVSEENDYWHICLRAPSDELIAALNTNPLYQWLLYFVVLIVLILIALYVLDRYFEYWKNMELFANKIMDENKFAEIQNEFVNSGVPASGMKSTLINIARLIIGLVQLNKASKDNSVKVERIPEFENHPVYRSNRELRDDYNIKLNKLENENSELKQIKQLTESIDKINEVLKLHHTDLEQMSIHVIHTLVDLLQIEMGAVFLLKTDENEHYLDLAVSYAYSENRFQKRRFNLGESLVGACAAEKRTIFLKKVPEDYLKIISGLGIASPINILIVPLVFENEALGVIELGSLQEMNDYMINLTERAAETIANTLSLTEINIKTTKLLEKTQQQTVELEQRDSKMNEALNELKDLQIKTSESEASVRAKLEAMNNTLMMVEYTTKGILLEANYKYLNTMNYALEDIRGIDVMELLDEADRGELAKVINTVKNGNLYEAVIRRHTRQGAEKWILATYTPVFNENDQVESILFFGIDITRIRKNEELLKQKSMELTKQVEELRGKLNKK